MRAELYYMIIFLLAVTNLIAEELNIYAISKPNEVAKLIDFELLSQSIKEINLEGLLDVYPKMLKGETYGRYIIDLNK